MPRFTLKTHLLFTVFVAVIAFGASMCAKDFQTGAMVVLFATGLMLVWLFLRIPLSAWWGIMGGMLVGAVWYRLSDAYYETVPADRSFELVLRAIWFSVGGGFLGFVIGRIRRRSD